MIRWIRVSDTNVPRGHDFTAPERGIRDVQIPCGCIDGHLIYREKIIKCVRRGVTSLIGRSGPVDICKYSMFVETGCGCFR